MATNLVIRLGATAVLFFTLPSAVERLASYWQFSPVFEGIVAIATCFGACLPVLTMFKNSD
ncbi:MAG: hypothetical protein CV045_04685 [Cyanobacteria bacterium M5B4]|nr:hypothetical protein [Cyanobacteria bacterium KgW148]PLS68991.1 MAG: hypothetical protein CV045_04685 [Cyanobacteria bacterium M5B4]